MSYVTDTGGEKYRGGYGSSSSFNPDELRVATSTFENYITGTVLLVFLIFFVFLFIAALTIFLMCYARYLHLRRPKGGFYDPPPMVTLYPRTKSSHGTSSQQPIYSTLSSRHSEATTATAGGGGAHSHASAHFRASAPSAMSQATEASYTATSTML